MNRKVGLVPLSGLAIAIAAAFTLTGCSVPGLGDNGVSAPTSTSSATSTSTPTPSESLDDANAKVTVTVDKGWSWDYPNRYAELVKKSFGADSTTLINGDEIPKIRTCSHDVTVKLWIDAVCGPLPESTRDVVVARVLMDADYAYMVCNGLYNTVFQTPLGDISFAENNPWMKEIGCDDTSQINDNAGKLVNDRTKAGELVSAKKLALIAELVERLHVTATGDGTPAWSYHLLVDNSSGSVTYVNPDDPENTVPEFELDPLSYTGQFLFMDITLKGVPNDCDSVGFNIGYNGVVNAKGRGGDGRFARFECPPPAPPTTGCTNCGSTKPPCTVTGNCCPYQLNADGQCIPPKDKSIKQPIPSDKPSAPVTPVEPSAPPVDPNPPVVVVPQVNQGGDSGSTHVTG
jgi:hypothetical protein